MRHHSASVFISLVALAIGGCAAIEQSTAPPVAAAEADDSLRNREPAADAVRFSLVSAKSTIRVLTFRDGPMARLGHNHVIAASGLTGTAWLTDDLADAIVRIVMPTTGLIIDAEALRQREGESFSDPVPERDIAATRENMLSEDLLNAAQHPFVRATCGDYRAEPGAIDCDIELAGTTSRLEIPLEIERDSRSIRATGEISVTHAQLGLTPFSAAGGAIRVADAMTIKFDLTAQRLSD